MSDGKLDGWKEIARHLGKSVKTAQRWEKQHGLPVRRLSGDGGKPSVFAFEEEIDGWLKERASGEGDDANDRSLPLRLSAPARWWLAGALTAAVSLAMIGYGWFASSPEPHTVRRIGDRRLVAYDAAGDPVWRRSFDEPFADRLRTGSAWFVADADGDGSVEVVFARRRPTSKPGEEDGILCFDADGDPMWTYRPGRRITIDGVAYEDEFQIQGLALGRRRGGDAFVVAVTNHRPYSPSLVVVLDRSGRAIGEYWHFGYVLDLLARDLDDDGTDEIVLGGINDALERPFVALLEAEIGAAMAPGPEEFPPELRQGREARYVALPATAASRALGVGAWVESLRPHEDGLLADVRFDDDSGIKERVYLLDGDLSVRRLDFGRTFVSLHESLLGDGSVTVDLKGERRRLRDLDLLVPGAGSTGPGQR